MLPNYQDIKDAAEGKNPLWYDGNGVPRYAPFTPDMLGIYIRFALLVEIECQSCAATFLVGEGWNQFGFYYGQDGPTEHTLKALAEGYHYGDPPRHGGCSGETMSCVDRQLLQAWEQVSASRVGPDGVRILTEMPHWERNGEIEGSVDIYPEWAR